VELEKVEERIHDTERTIQRLSKELDKLGARSASGDKSTYDQLSKLSWEMAQAQAKLEQLMGEWEKLVV
jgi:predicted  nucleic acid-binding Zn-ribbon protein